MVWIAPLLCMLLIAAHAARADELRFGNGDRLSGTLVRLVDGKLAFESEALGPLEIDAARVHGFSTVAPVELHARDGVVYAGALEASEGRVIASPQGPLPVVVLALDDVESINPLPVSWHGSVAAGASFHRGNSFTDESHSRLDAVRETETYALRVKGSYDGDRNRDLDTGVRTTTERRVFGALKYDHFLSERWYASLASSGEKDGVRDLDLRWVAGPGLGYRWLVGPRTTLFTEAGLSYVDESYGDNDLDDEYVAALLRWGLTRKLADTLDAFHDGTWLPSLKELDDRMLVRTETGLRAKLVRSLFVEGKLRWEWDAEPADDRERVDVDYILGLGFGF